VADLDLDGYLSMYELETFYKDQVSRLVHMNLEPIPFSYILCQMLDMMMPDKHTRISLIDIKKCKMGANLFNILFDMNKVCVVTFLFLCSSSWPLSSVIRTCVLPCGTRLSVIGTYLLAENMIS